ncbi:transglutaminase domain-containing protein [Zhouia sp. PK063]|uniref:transglutaminase domain-containing protein n=1 Tax=Zhouia sp. PK063 TaxID=3373602 RepID=UPI0037A49C19
MKSYLLIFIAIMLSLNSYSQQFQRVDSITYNYPKNIHNFQHLVNRINTDFSTDKSKVRAIYNWMCLNITYDIKEKGKFDFHYRSTEEFKSKQSRRYQRLVNHIMNANIAVCEGYAVLFKQLCNELHIKCDIVTGASKTVTHDIGKRFIIDHAWNIVYLNKKPYLIDVTWGDTNVGSAINYDYFLSDPDFFIQTHYPDHFENSLLKNIIYKEQFAKLPLIYSQNSYKLISKQTGILNKIKTPKINFEFSTNKKIHQIVYMLNKKSFIVNDIIYNGKTVKFTVDLNKNKYCKEAILYFDSEPVIGFKVMNH